MTPNPGFKVKVLFKGKYLMRQAYHRTLVGNHRQAIEGTTFTLDDHEF